MALILRTAVVLPMLPIALSLAGGVSGSSAPEPSAKRDTNFDAVNGIDQSATTCVYAMVCLLGP